MIIAKIGTSDDTMAVVFIRNWKGVNDLCLACQRDGAVSVLPCSPDDPRASHSPAPLQRVWFFLYFA